MITRYKRFLSAFLALVLCVGILPITGMAKTVNGLDNFVKTAAYSDSTFTDVHKDDWFYENVRSVYEYALMRGKGNNCFAPESNVTIAEVITIAARLHAQYTSAQTCSSKSEPWYQIYADYAENCGILEEIPDNLSAPATRGEFAEIISRALPESALEEINIVAYSGIPDVSFADSYSRAVYKLYRAGIMIGNDATGTFAPESNIKRSEVAAIVTRMVVPALRKSVQLGEEYTVSFDLSYRGLKLEEQTVVQGYAAEEPEEPTRQNYIFEGWYTAKTGGYKFAFETEILSDMTLYARWKMDPAWFAVMMNGMIDGDKEDEDETEEAYDYGKLPYRPGKSWEELIECNGGEEPYIEMNDNDQIGLYIGKISDTKVEDVYDVIAELNNVRDLLNINDARFEFVPSYDDGRIDDKSYRVQQVYNGVQVWCAQIVVIVDDDGYINGFISNYVDYVRYSSVETEPAVSGKDAIRIAYKDATSKFDTVNENIFAALVIMPESGDLIWYMAVSCGSNAYSYYVDAITGRLCGYIEIVDQTSSIDLNATDIDSIRYATTSLYDATINITRLHKTDNTDMFIYYDSTYYDEHMEDGNSQHAGVAIYNSVDQNGKRIDPEHKNSNGQNVDSLGNLVVYPYNIIANSANKWYPDRNKVHYSGLYALYNFDRIMEQYANLGYIVNMPIEVNVNLDWDNASYSHFNSTESALEFRFGTSRNPSMFDWTGHEYTHSVQDYYVGVVSIEDVMFTALNRFKNGSLGDGYCSIQRDNSGEPIYDANGDVKLVFPNSSNIDWIESKAISEGTADIMGMLIEAICEGNIDDDGRIADIDSFLLFGEYEDGKIRDHTENNTAGNRTVEEMIQYYQNTRCVTMTKEWNGNPEGKRGKYTLAEIDKLNIPKDSYTIDFLIYGEGPGHYDGYIVVGILRNLIEQTNLTANELLRLWYTTITMLNAKSEFDYLRFALELAAKKIGLDAYKDDIINACESVGISYNRQDNVYNAWFYKGLAKAYNHAIITENDALNNANNIVTRREYLDLLAELCKKVGVVVDSDVVAWAKKLQVIGDTWTEDYLSQSIPRWQAALLMYQIINHYNTDFQTKSWKVVYGYAFVSESGTDQWQNFKNVHFNDWGTAVTGINIAEMVQYYKGCAKYNAVTKEISIEDSIKAFQEQYMASKSTSKTYVTGANDEDTRQAMYYMGFYQLWLNGMFHGYSSSGKVLLGTTDSISLGEACALITQVIPD